MVCDGPESLRYRHSYWPAWNQCLECFGTRPQKVRDWVSISYIFAYQAVCQYGVCWCHGNLNDQVISWYDMNTFKCCMVLSTLQFNFSPPTHTHTHTVPIVWNASTDAFLENSSACPGYVIHWRVWSAMTVSIQLLVLPWQGTDDLMRGFLTKWIVPNQGWRVLDSTRFLPRYLPVNTVLVKTGFGHPKWEKLGKTQLNYLNNFIY